MIILVRRDLRDGTAPYLWTDEELARHLSRALTELSEALPLPAKAVLPTVKDSREVGIAGLANRVMVLAVEYPLNQFPPVYQRFSLWGDSLTILSGPEPDGSDCTVYYGALHTLNAASSTLPAKYEDLAATGAAGYAAISLAGGTINRVNTGGRLASQEYHTRASRHLPGAAKAAGPHQPRQKSGVIQQMIWEQAYAGMDRTN
jgi:hypothetical protein